MTAFTFSLPALAETTPPVALAIHGGAGTIDPEKMSDEKRQAIAAKLDEALTSGYRLLQNGGSALDAVEAAVRVLEDSPLFNAGVGAVYTWEEGHELDASIMDGATLEAGAVAGVRTVRNPISLARKVMTDSPHVMLAGEGAEAFARSQGVEMVPNSHFDTESRLKSLKEAKEKILAREGVSHQAAVESLESEFKMGTVGAVALDSTGTLAAATSTGGMTAKRWGRVGDSPVIGAGTYADDAVCAISATGHGEYFIRYNVAADICARAKYQGILLAEAADEVILKRLKQAGGTGGVITLDPEGRVAMPFNTEGMYRASIDAQGNKQIAIWQSVIEP
ncbi:isoaspartyl peptidase/L-asparaginase family protein [Ferrimonas balearica]|uniref:isoaspartyl peptidase/L-asparaginase family protein n=1 Tax=Ferrimonas balearica TaxID=44012 RepID=UPI001C993D76|nr:isoaspartyl peptidase/L-asparaginase [Ferrimonas balearica]MBY5920900.1 isoaspartyl peptidase/L-asparaginase [Ferrimonas balearica]MBY5996415.1 isoaspartyl peptidase/L-asparaginase [Ferrimonas balearica]